MIGHGWLMLGGRVCSGDGSADLVACRGEVTCDLLVHGMDVFLFVVLSFAGVKLGGHCVGER